MTKHILMALWLKVTENPPIVIMLLILVWALASMFVAAGVSEAAGMIMISALAVCLGLALAFLLLVLVLSFFQDVYDIARYTKSIEERDKE